AKEKNHGEESPPHPAPLPEGEGAPLVTRHLSLAAQRSDPSEDQVAQDRRELAQSTRRIHLDFPKFLRREAQARGREQARGGRLRGFAQVVVAGEGEPVQQALGSERGDSPV